MSKLEELRNRLRSEAEKTKSQTSNDKSNYPFWNIPEGEYATVRFLPDGDVNSDLFWVTSQTIKLPFAGVRGKSTKQVFVTVPCMHTYGESCPVMEAIKPMWTSDEQTARTYYKKKSYILQAFVRKDGVNEENPPENPIRKLVLNSKLYNTVHAGLLDPEMEDIPTDYSNGTDFNIYKTKTGQWASYDTSRWARKTSSLTEAELEAIDKFGLPSLNSYLPKKPTADVLNVIMEMFTDSLAGEAYDVEKYGEYYRPYRMEDDTATPTQGSGSYQTKTTVASKPVAQAPAEKAHVEDEAPFDGGTPVKAATVTSNEETKKPNVQDLLAAIKSKKAEG